MSRQLIEALLRHRYTHHTRELDRVLRVAIRTSPAHYLALTPEVRAALQVKEGRRGAVGGRKEGLEDIGGGMGAIGREEIERALAETGGNVTEATRLLGLKNRYVLYRLMKRHGVSEPGDDPTEA